MVTKDEVTVIVPCYNAEQYLELFFKNLSKQTLKNFNVILVDDASTDKTKKILEKYCKDNKNYQLISNSKNEGAGFSRNRAIEKVKTKYIAFLDADDIFPEDYLDKLYQGIEKERADIAVCDIQVKYDDSFGYRPEEYNKLFSNNVVTKKKLIDNTLAASPANKMIKTDILKNNLFAEGIINEDIPAIIGSILDSKKISYVTNTYYTYVQHGNSVQNSSLSPKKLDVFKAMEILYDRKKDSALLSTMSDALVFHQILLFFFFGICPEPKYKIRKQYMKKFDQLTRGKYELRGNEHYWNFIDTSPKLVKIYYKSILKLNCMKQYWASSFLVSLYKCYKNMKPHPMTSVIKDKITLKDVKKMAQKNQKCPNEVGTISVVVPNYNYANYLYRRLYSVFYQKEKIEELILLDDCSSDHSHEVLKEIYEELKSVMKVKLILNEQNSGCVYKQWQKGFKNATSEYVWIAEADDYSDDDFLMTAMKPFKKDQEIRLSYTDTSFMLVNGNPTLRSMNILIDLMKTKHWEKDYINDGINEIENYCFLNCTIANASSVVFKNDNYDKEFEESTKYKQVGDWLFYVNVMKKGKIAYTHKSLNYCCIHEGSSTATTKKILHYNEIKELHERFLKEYNIPMRKQKYIAKRLRQVRREWDLHI